MDERSITRQGFTLVEALVVFAFIAIVSAMALIGFQNYARFQQYNQAVSDVTFVLNQARLDARSAALDDSHGVKFSATSITQFVGTPYSVGDPQNEITEYSLVTLQYDLSDGGDTVVFEKLTGLPSATGTVTVSGVDYAASTTIQITGTGVVQ